MEKNAFQYCEEQKEFVATINDIEFLIYENDWADTIIEIAQKMSDSYSKKINEVARFIALDQGFIVFYGSLSTNEIIKKLNKPVIRVCKDGGILTYLNHEFDDVHIIDVDFIGIFEVFNELSIDG